MKRILLITLFALSFIGAVGAEKLPVVNRSRPERDLYELFRSPDMRYRPYVRWWWNGGRVTEAEILRELDLMREAGIGGVEINTIRFPDQTADTAGCASLAWLSDKWLRMVEVAAAGCRERGMTCDIIVGSGWPFGAEYLVPEEQAQMLYPVTIDARGGRFSVSRDEILRMASVSICSTRENPTKELLFIRRMPKRVDTFTEGVSYDELVANDTITIDLPEGEHVLYFFVKLSGYMQVILGAPGASGPIVNHLDAAAVERYLDKFSSAMRFVGGPVAGKIRAAFCDSFELEGDNWTPDMLAEFERRAGYSLDPYLPYVIGKTGAMGEPVNEDYGCEFSPEVTREVIERVRRDFWHVQIDLFRENFIDTYNRWCHRNGLRSRVQAYGHQLHPVESSMYIDIPECESWIHDGIGRTMNSGEYLSGRGYSMVNKAVSSGAWLSGRNVVSCEEQTNVGNIFQTTLEEIKVTGDRSNLSGVNHSILHGFNYSPPQEDFLGWVQFGTYFNEHNPWWPYLRRWTDYKTRVSALLQNCVYRADIAVLQPWEDLWSVYGMQRDPYPGVTYPAYANDLWEAMMQHGDGCDYVSENVIRQSTVRGGRLRFGDRSYGTLLLLEVERLDPAAAERIAAFVAAGGRVIAVGKVPRMAPGLKGAEAGSARVKAVFERMRRDFPQRFVLADAPSGDLLAWYGELQRRCGLTPGVRIADPDRFLSVNRYVSGDRDIYFFVNSSVEHPQRTRVEFPGVSASKRPWLWNAETGERYRLELRDGGLDLDLGPAEAQFVVFDREPGGEPLPQPALRNANPVTLDGVWTVRATHRVDGSVREFRLTDLVDLHALPFEWLQQFAGTLEYTQPVEIDDPAAFRTLDAGETFNGLTEVLVNGVSAGVRWYGARTFEVGGLLREGQNVVTVRVVTTLTDWVKAHASDLSTARRWEWAQRLNAESGLRGPVSFY